MVYKDEKLVKDPIYEDIFWFFYKEYILIMDFLKFVDFDTGAYNWRRIFYFSLVAFPVLFMFLLFTVTCITIILKISS